MGEITRLRRTTAAHRGLVTRLIPRCKEALDRFVPNKKKDLLKFKKNVEEKSDDRKRTRWENIGNCGCIERWGRGNSEISRGGGIWVKSTI